MDELIKKIKAFIGELETYESYISNFEDDLDLLILKAIIDSPLIHFWKIRQNVFRWTKDKLLESAYEIINSDRNNQKFNIKLHRLQFLLKRSVHLQSNFIISKEFMELMKHILETLQKEANQPDEPNVTTGNPTEKDTSESNQLELYGKSNQRNLPPIDNKGFIYYVISLIKELLYDHETKSIKLEKVLKEFIYDENDDNNANFNHFLRLLRLENTEAINRLEIYYLNNKKNYKDNRKITDYTKDPKYINALETSKPGKNERDNVEEK